MNGKFYEANLQKREELIRIIKRIVILLQLKTMCFIQSHISSTLLNSRIVDSVVEKMLVDN